MRKTLLASFTLCVSLAACVVTPPKTTPPQPPQPPPAVSQSVTFDTVVCDGPADSNGHCKPIQGATVTVDDKPVRVQTSNADGYNLWVVPDSLVDTFITVKADGFDDFAWGTIHPKDLAAQHNLLTLKRSHVDPSEIPLGKLAQIRGAMWPTATGCPGLLLPFGPRPGSQDNIIATDFFANYSSEQQLAIVHCLHDTLGYTHVVMGPIVDSDGYHGQYAPHDWHWEDPDHMGGDNWEKFLDIAQYFYDHGLTPVVFLHPDGWTFEQTRDVLTPLLQLPRAQRLLRIVVPTGWEPTKYDWSSCTWAAFAQWARQTLPHALVLIHTVTDVDAPVGTDARCDDNGHPNGEGWSRIAPFIHGWLVQNGAYETSPAENPTLARNFAAQFMPDGDGATTHGAAWHFAHAIAGWPTGSAWGDGIPICLYAAEQTSYTAFWRGMPEASRTAWGDLAVASGACGYLDGGTVEVPRLR